MTDINGYKTEAICFDWEYQLRKFIMEVFQLKPYLVTTFALNNFRLVIEIHGQSNSSSSLAQQMPSTTGATSGAHNMCNSKE